jgi:hypothetical protein
VLHAEFFHSTLLAIKSNEVAALTWKWGESSIKRLSELTDQKITPVLLFNGRPTTSTSDTSFCLKQK